MNGVSDAAGNLLFHIVDGEIYDANGYLIDDLRNSGVNIIGIEEMPIVPFPNSCTKFYIITGFVEDLTAGPGSRPYPVYSVIDMAAQNLNFPLDPTKKGALQYFSGAFPTGTNIFDLSTIAPAGSFPVYALHDERNLALAVTPLRTPTNDYFLFVKGKDKIFRFVIDATGITYGIGSNPFMVPSGPAYQNNTYATEMEVVRMTTTGNYRLAYVYSDLYIPYPEISYTTGALVSNNFITMPNTSTQTPRAVGLEFSPDGRYLYWTHTSAAISTYNNAIHYLDITGGGSPTPLTTATYPGSSLLQTSFIEIAHNNKMYFNNGTYLSSLGFTGISYAPFATNWTNNAINISSANNLLPDQLDGNSSGGAGALISSYTAGTFPYTATTQVWTPTSNPFGGAPGSPIGTATNPIIILNNLIIPAGYNITIQGMRFEFAGRTYDIMTGLPLLSGAFVQVLRSNSSVIGGRLTLDGSTLTHTNSCRTGMWEGIEVQGNSGVSQGVFSTGKQGWLLVKNASIVENAYHAVVLARITNTFNGVPGTPIAPAIDITYSGGSVQVLTSSRFRNNYIDVYFGDYDYVSTSIDNNNSAFDNCFFETTPTVITASPTTTTITVSDLDPNLNFVNWLHHILVGVKGVTYSAVTFQNMDITNLAYDILLNKRGFGIFSINSYFTVSKKFAPPFNRGKFNNLSYGVYAADFGSIKTFAISECDFSDNYRGVYAGSVNYEKITQCKFMVNRFPASTMPIPSDAAYGVYLDFCKGFVVQENDFSYAGLTTPAANSFGVIVNQSNYKRNCTQHDEIYKNSFHNILAGGRAQGNNSEQDVATSTGSNFCYGANTPNNVGLEFLCNNFTGNVDNSDLSITRSQSLTTAGNIAYQQGYISSTTNTPAGNAFSHTAGAFDFYSEAFSPTLVNGAVLYSCHNDVLTIPVTIVSPLPILPPYFLAAGGPVYNPALSCPSKISVGHSPFIIRQEIVSFENKVALLQAKIDGGNTGYLLSQIYGSMSDGLLKNLLLSRSPYLSDRVLIAYINRLGVSAGNLKQVIIANSPVTKPVMDALNSIGLSTGLLKQINNVQTGVSGRGKLESEIAYYTSQRAYNIDELVRTYSNDSTLDNGVDSILTVFKTYNVQQNATDITLAYLTKGDVVKANFVNDSLKTAGTDTSFTKMMDVAIALKQTAQQESNLLTDSTLKTKVDELAALTDAKESTSASAVLKLLFNYMYHEYIEPVSWDMPGHSMMQMESDEENESYSTNLYPNPTSGVSNFSYTLQEGETGEMQIFDIAGKLIQSYKLTPENNILNMNNTELNSGTYMYKYSVNGIVSKTDKLIIVK